MSYIANVPEQPRHLANKYEDINSQGRGHIVAASRLQLVYLFVHSVSENSEVVDSFEQRC